MPVILKNLKYLKNFRLSYIGKVFSLMGRREKIIALGLVGLAIVSLFWSVRNFYMAHTNAAPGNGGSYSEGLVGQPQYINPLLATTATDLTLQNLIFRGLYKYNGQGQLIPDLAESMPQISDDQKQYTINLKKDISWQNGRPFTADDVIFTIQTLQDPNYNSPLRNLWLSTTVEKISDTQVKFTTKDVAGPFLYNLTLPIISKSIWQNVGAGNFLTSASNLQAVGTGPYAIKEIQKERSGKIDQIVLTGKMGISTITLKFYDNQDDLLNAFHSREIQGLGFTAQDSTLHIDQNNQTQVYKIPLPQYQVLFYNLNNKILSDLGVRLALDAAVDRQGLIDNVFKDNAQLPGNPFTFLTSQTAPTTSNFNLDAAKTALTNAGWIADPNTGLRSKKSQPLKLNIATNDTVTNAQTAQAIADSWKQLGVQASLTVLSTQDLSNNLIRPRKFDVLIFPIKLGADPDPFSFWQSSQIKDPGLNLTGFANQTADQLMGKARATTDPTARETLYEQLSNLLNQQGPALFLTQNLYQYAISSKIKNINLSLLYDPSLRFDDISNWYMVNKRVWK